MIDGLLWPAPQRDIYTRLWGCNSALSSSAIGGVFLWFCCLVKLINFSAHIHTDDCSNLKSDVCSSSETFLPSLQKIISTCSSCVTLSSPMASPFSLHYRPARGLSACRLSSLSSFPLRFQQSADCLCLWSPTPR